MTKPNTNRRRPSPYFYRPPEEISEAVWARFQRDIGRLKPQSKDYHANERARLSSLGLIGPSPTNGSTYSVD